MDCDSKQVIELRALVARYSNPWTVEIFNHGTQRFEAFCHDAPLTLMDAEQRVEEYKREVYIGPDAQFRVVPWLNSSQWQHVYKYFNRSTDA